MLGASILGAVMSGGVETDYAALGGVALTVTYLRNESATSLLQSIANDPVLANEDDATILRQK